MPPTSLLDAFIITLLLAMKKFLLWHVLPRYNRYLLPHNCLFPACLRTWQIAHRRETRDVLPGCPEDDWGSNNHWGILLTLSSLTVCTDGTVFTLAVLAPGFLLFHFPLALTYSPCLTAPSRSHFTTTDFQLLQVSVEKKKKRKRNLKLCKGNRVSYGLQWVQVAN